MKHYKPHYAENFPKKIYVKLQSGETVLRSVRWGDFLPDWLDSADKSALVPYVVIDNNPCIICTHNGEVCGLVTLSAYLESYGVQLLSSCGRKEKNWWRYIA